MPRRACRCRFRHVGAKDSQPAAPVRPHDQREDNRLYGYTARQTLDLLQTLYEKKLATYPRTDSQFLTEDMRDTATGIAAYLMETQPFAHGQPFTPDIGRVINNAKVSDHHAIIPTAQLMKTDITTVKKNISFEELTPEILNTFIEKI